MKRFNIIASIAVCMFMLSVGVSAENVYDKTIDYTNGKIVFTGNTDKKLIPLTIQAFKGDKKALDFVNSVSLAADYVVHVDQVILDENGDFEFTFDYKGDSSLCDEKGIEKLNLCLVYEDTKQIENYPIAFINNSTYESVVDVLNDTDLSTFKTKVNEYPFLFDFDSDLAKQLNLDKVTELLYYEVQDFPLDKSDSIEIKKTGTNFVLAQAINEGKLSSVLRYLDNLNISKELLEDIKFFVVDVDTEQKFISTLTGKKIESSEDLENAFKEAVILTAVRYPQGFMNLKNLCEKHSAFLGFSGATYSNAAYSAVAGSTTINSLGELKNQLASNVSAGSGSGNGSGGGSGGGSGSGSGSGMSISVPGFIGNGDQKQTINMPFEDLGSVEWAHVAISTLANRGIINGKSETEYCPNDHITREEFAKILACTANLPLNVLENKFYDVDTNAWYAPYVNAAYENGFCNGIEDNKFGIGLNITRQDAAVMIYNSLKGINVELTINTEIEFNDKAYISDYATEAIKKLSGEGLINGDNNKNLNPKAFLTRAEAAQLVYNCLKFF